MMKVDLPALLAIFDFYLSTEQQQLKGHFDFKQIRTDGIVIAMYLFDPDSSAEVLVFLKNNPILKMMLYHCHEIRVLDEKKKIVEIIYGPDPDNVTQILLMLDTGIAVVMDS
jgi:hypothetical protein